VRYTKTLRISVVWNDGEDNSRNARAIIFGIRNAAEKAVASGFTEIIIATSHPKMRVFLERVMKMTRSGDEYLLAV
jgi:D-aminopeptidase